MGIARDTPGRALGLYWGAVAAALLLLMPLAPEAALAAPPCLFRSLTGLPCPTCGATHAMVALSQLRLASALGNNPLVAAAAVAFLLGGLAAGIAALAGRPFREPTSFSLRFRLAAAGAVLGNWAWLLAHRG
ncbi:MAG TPA: DUF2752 domain-containing protein [Thermoanaerobaculia bacterium]|nr:DUF2752 domain-containing protein [Thermoanaerobaculia bacterium]